MTTSSFRRLLSPLASAALAACCLLGTAAFGQGTYNWNVNSGTWNTTTANWIGSGTTWVNGTSNNAVFNNTSGATVTISGSISAGDVSFGDASNNRSWTLSSGTLTAAGNLAYQGSSSNSGAYGSNPTLTISSNVNVAGSTLVGRANLTISGGTFTTNRISTNPTSADWANLTISGGSVTATNGVDGTYGTSGSNGTTATFNVNLNGGTLSTTYLKVADREAGTNNNAWLTLNGGTLRALSSTSNFIQTYGGGNNVMIANNGAFFDTNGFDITVGTILNNYSGQTGALTKNGSGTLRLTQSNKYTGGTTVNAGMLVLASAAWTLDNVGGAGVTVGNGATLRADNSVANQLAGLTLNGGTVDAVGGGNADWGNFFLTGDVTASGSSNLNAELALRATNVDFNVANSGTLNVGGVMHNGANFGIYSGSPATVSKSGAGTMVFSAANTYTGATTVNTGTLTYQNTYASPTHTIASGAVLDFNVASGSRDYAATTFSGSGTLRKTGNGTVVWGPGVATFSLGAGSLIDVQGGTFTGGSYGNDVWTSNQSDLNVASGATFNTVEANVRVNGITGNGTIQTGYTGAGYQNLTIGVNNGSSTFNGVIADATAAGNLVKSGTGVIALGGANTYTGSTTVNAGTLSVSSDANLGGVPVAPAAGRIVLNGGSLAASADFAINANRGIALGPTSGTGSGSIDVVSGKTLSYAGILANNGGTGGLTKTGAGTLALSGTSTYSGTTAVSAGTLQLTGSLASPSVTVAAGAALAGRATAPATTVATGGILSPGVVGSGTLSLASLAFSGSGTVNVGVQGTSPSSLLNVVGNLTTGGGPGSVLFAFGNSLATITSGTYSLLTYGGTPLSDVSAFGVSGVSGARQSVNLANGTGAVNLVIGNAFPIWSGINGSDWTTTDDWVLNTTGSATTFLPNDTVVFNDSGSTGTVTLSQNVNPATTTFSGTTLAYTLSSSGGFGITSGALVKSGPASLTISTSNSFAGGTTLSAGTLVMGNAAALGSGAVTVAGNAALQASVGGTFANDLVVNPAISGTFDAGAGAVTLTGGVANAGTLTLASTGSQTLAGVVSGTGAVVKTGAGALVLSGSNTYSGNTTIAAGTLTIGNAGVLGGGSYGGTIANAATLAYASSADQTLSGAISGTGSLLKSGAGTLVLAANNSYTGNTTITAGTLTVGGTGALGGGAYAGTIANAATLSYASSANQTLSGEISGAGSLIKSGAGTLVLAANNSFTGATTVNAGTLSVSSDANLGGVPGSPAAGRIVLNGGSLSASADFTLNANRGIALGPASGSGSGSIDVASGKTLSYGGIMANNGGTGGLTKTGAGTLTLSGANSYSGGTTISAGKLTVGNASALGTSTATVSGGTLDLAGFTIGNAVTLSSGTLLGTSGTSGVGAIAVGSGVIDRSSGTLSAGAVTIGTTSASPGVTNVFAGSGRLAAASFIVQGNSSNQNGAGTGSPVTISSGTLTTTGNLGLGRWALTLGGSSTVSVSGTIGGGGISSSADWATLTIQDSAVVTATGGVNGNAEAWQLNLNGGTLSTPSIQASDRESGGAARLVFNGTKVIATANNASFVTVGANFGNTNSALVGNGGVDIDSAGFDVGIGIDLKPDTSSTGGLTKRGAGTLTLSGSNSFSGGTQIANGTLQLGSNTGLPTSSAVTLGTGSTSATLAFGSNTATLRSIAYNGTGSTVSAGGKLNLLASGTSNALITVSSGSHSLHPDTSLQSNTVIDTAAGSFFSLHGIIDGTKSLTKLGSGTMAISGANTYSGGTYLNGGYVSVLNSGALGSGTSTVTIDGNTLLNLNNTILSNPIVFGSGSGAIINSGTLVNVSGTYSITSGTGSSITTNYNVQGGNISFVNNLASTIDIQNAAAGTFTSDVLEAGTVRVYGGGQGAFSGGVAGNVTSAGASTFSGSVTGNVTVTGGTSTFSTATGTGSAINVNAGLATFSAAIGGVAHATQAGATIEISGNVLDNADINAEAGGTVKLLGNGSFAAPTLDNDGSVVVDRSASLTLAAVIQGTGSLAKLGTGVLNLTGANTYSGPTTVSAGGLKVNGLLGSGSVSITNNAWLGGSGTIAGPVFVSGTLSPGNSPGLLTVGSLALDATSTTLIELTDSLVRGTGFDGVDVTTASGLTYGGLLSLAFNNTLPFADNTTFDIFAFTGSAAGAFTSVTSTGYYAGTWTSLGSGNFELVSGGQTLTFSQATGDIIVVPEPTTLALVGLGGLLATLACRRRARRV